MNSESGIRTSIKVVIVTDHVLLGDGIEKMLEDVPDITVTGKATCMAEAIQIANGGKSDVILLYPYIFEREHLSLVEKIKGNLIHGRVLLLADQLDEESTLQALSLGIYGCLPRWASFHDLIKAIRTVSKGDVWAPRKLMSKLFSEASRPAICPERLTRREEEIARLIGQGYTNREIATKLYVSEKTIKCHVTNIFKKMGVDSRLKVALQFQHKPGALPVYF